MEKIFLFLGCIFYLGAAEKAVTKPYYLSARHIVYIQPYYLIDLRKIQEIL
jgi:hypothetical protein